MLNRFKDQYGNDELPLETQDVMVNWADYAEKFQTYAPATTRILSEMIWMRFEGKLPLDSVEAAVELQLQDVAPDLLMAASGLQRSLQAVQGWQVNWRNVVRGEVIAINEDSTSIPDVTKVELVRGPNEFEEDTAWIANSLVGVMPGVEQYGAWLAINYYQGETNGLFIPIGGMFEIELRPPDKAEPGG